MREAPEQEQWNEKELWIMDAVWNDRDSTVTAQQLRDEADRLFPHLTTRYERTSIPVTSPQPELYDYEADCPECGTATYAQKYHDGTWEYYVCVGCDFEVDEQFVTDLRGDTDDDY